ncbi:hypothetical protein Gotur_002109 [Gossypium turneri]
MNIAPLASFTTPHLVNMLMSFHLCMNM